MLLAGGLFGALLALRFARFWRTPIYVLIGVLMWLAVLESGVHPSVVGLAMGLLVNAYAPRPLDIARVQVLGRSFLMDPTPSRALAAQSGLVGRGITERTAPAADPAVEQLRHRAAVRAGERRGGALG